MNISDLPLQSAHAKIKNCYLITILYYRMSVKMNNENRILEHLYGPQHNIRSQDNHIIVM